MSSLMLEKETKLLELPPGQCSSGSAPKPDFEPPTEPNGPRYTPPNPPTTTTEPPLGDPIPSGEMRQILSDLVHRIHKGPRSLSLTMREAYSLREAILMNFRDYDYTSYTKLKEELYG